MQASDLTFEEYQYQAAKTAVYPGRGKLNGLLYAALGLAGEAGEIANEVKKILRDDGELITFDRRTKLFKELGDVLWYIAAMTHELDEQLGEIAVANIEKLRSRKERGVLQGSGEDR